jgi:N-acetylmuramoyl-L-alanine amidase
MLPIKQNLDPDDHYNGTNAVRYICLHDTGNYNDSDEGNAKYFVTGTRNASAHYFVDDNSITQVVLDHDGAFHCGDGHGANGITNNNSLGIEMCRVNGTVTAQTESNTLELVRAKMKEYNVPIDRVVRHYDASRKLCPYSFMANGWIRWTRFKNNLYNNIVVASPIVVTAKKPGYNELTAKLQDTLNRLWFTDDLGRILVVDGLEGENTRAAVRKFQKVAGLAVDGRTGANTWNALNTILMKPVLKFGSKGVAVRYVQFRFDLPIDGSFGVQTKGRVKSYQYDCGLVQDGIVGPGTYRKLIG